MKEGKEYLLITFKCSFMLSHPSLFIVFISKLTLCINRRLVQLHLFNVLVETLDVSNWQLDTIALWTQYDKC